MEAEPNVSSPGAKSPIGKKIHVAEIPPVAKSHGPKSNAFAYTKNALST